MLLILPIAAFIFFYLILRKKGVDWRRASLAAAVFWGTSVVVITETLSVPRLLTRDAVAFFWLAICVAILAYLIVLSRRSLRPSPAQGSSGERLGRATKGLLIATVIIVLFVLTTALVAAPNTWDAMDYHLPRVVMWMSNHCVRFYPTPDYAQLIFGPWAEYAMMHTMLLWGSDRFVNLIEFFSLLGCVTGASLIAKRLGAGLRGQALAAVVCATIPEGLLEASGPMNTYVVAFWIVATVAFLMSWNEDPGWLNTVCIGLSAGLALLTKGTAYIYLPFLVLACWWMGPNAARIRLLKRSVILLLLILAVNAPQYLRCYRLTGSPLGLPFPDGGPRLHWRGDDLRVRGILANVVRNASVHLATPSSAVNARIGSIVRLTIRGFGVNPDDPGMTWPGEQFTMNHFSLSEIHAGNPLHFTLLIVSIGLLILGARNGPGREAVLLAVALVASFLLFCGVLRWQQYVSRHHLPLFVLGSALAGLALDRYFSKKVGSAIAIGFLACALPFAVANRTRSLVPWSLVTDVYDPRAELYFADQHQLIAKDYIAMCDALNASGCRGVAFDAYNPVKDSQMLRDAPSFFIYPIFALSDANGRRRRVWYVDVHNLSVLFQKNVVHPSPCRVVCLSCAHVPGKWAEYSPESQRAQVYGDNVVFTVSRTFPAGQIGGTSRPWR